MARSVRMGILENRHIIRALINMGVLLWKEGNSDESYGLFMHLLKSNPMDNAGVRYYILAILEKMPEVTFKERFDKGGYWNNEIDIWFSGKSKHYKKELGWWLEQL